MVKGKRYSLLCLKNEIYHTKAVCSSSTKVRRVGDKSLQPKLASLKQFTSQWTTAFAIITAEQETVVTIVKNLKKLNVSLIIYKQFDHSLQTRLYKSLIKPSFILKYSHLG